MKDTKPKTRTNQQNKALHVGFNEIAKMLNEAGLDMKKVIRADIPWNSTTVKEHLFRPVMRTQLQKESTKELSTREIDQVWDTLNRILAQEFGVSLPFPSIEELIHKTRDL